MFHGTDCIFGSPGPLGPWATAPLGSWATGPPGSCCPKPSVMVVVPRKISFAREYSSSNAVPVAPVGAYTVRGCIGGFIWSGLVLGYIFGIDYYLIRLDYPCIHIYG